MKKGLLATTALIGAGVLAGGAAVAAEAPEWKLSGGMNFQLYWVDQDNSATKNGNANIDNGATRLQVNDLNIWNAGVTDAQDHDWYFGVDEAELAIKVSGAADNGLKYGFKIELQTNTDDGKVADEAVISLSGGWGTLQFGDEDGAEDIMNYGGENLMGATGGFDGDQGDVLYRGGGLDTGADELGWDDDDNGVNDYELEGPATVAALSGPTIAGDTSDVTKISYFSPRFSGFQVGVSITPTLQGDSKGPGGNSFQEDSDFENHYGLGANYDNTFGNLNLKASAVYSAASSNDTRYEDIAAWSVGGIVGFGPFSIGANYTDNGDSGARKVFDVAAGIYTSGGTDSSYWNVAASFETGPMTFSAGYFASTLEIVGLGPYEDSTYEHTALAVDYTVAPGLSTYAEVSLISDELLGGATFLTAGGNRVGNDTTLFILGINASF